MGMVEQCVTQSQFIGDNVAVSGSLSHRSKEIVAPKGAAWVAMRQSLGNNLTQRGSAFGKSAKCQRQQIVHPRADMLRQNRRGPFCSNGHYNRVAVNNGGDN